MASPLAIAGATVAAAAAGVMLRAMFAPRSQFFGHVLFRGSTDEPSRIALTFDDGPHPVATPRVLDILREHRVPAAFFVIGRFAERHPELIRSIHDEGHLIGNHSWTHSAWGTFRHKRYWREEIGRADALIESIVGRRPALFRPPMGFKTFHITKSAMRAGHATVTWSQRAFDGVRTSEHRIMRRLSARVSAGDIVLLHDGEVPPFRRNLEATIAALPRLIEAWRSRGLRLVRLDELLGEPAYQGQVKA
jgi:peptidoglycan-N-acetylglucosamine deacetylase